MVVADGGCGWWLWMVAMVMVVVNSCYGDGGLVVDDGYGGCGWLLW